MRNHRARQGTQDMFGAPQSQRALQVQAEQRAQLLGQLPLLSIDPAGIIHEAA